MTKYDNIRKIANCYFDNVRDLSRFKYCLVKIEGEYPFDPERKLSYLLTFLEQWENEVPATDKDVFRWAKSNGNLSRSSANVVAAFVEKINNVFPDYGVWKDILRAAGYGVCRPMSFAPPCVPWWTIWEGYCKIC